MSASSFFDANHTTDDLPQKLTLRYNNHNHPKRMMKWNGALIALVASFLGKWIFAYRGQAKHPDANEAIYQCATESLHEERK